MFEPSWTSPPGETALDLMVEQGLSPTRLAEAFDWTDYEITSLLSGRTAVDGEIAGLLSRFVGGTPEFWCERERHFSNSIARVAEAADSQTVRQWLTSLPARDMEKRGWIASQLDQEKRLCDALRFFGVTSIDRWQEKYQNWGRQVPLRTSGAFELSVHSLAAWLRRGEVQASVDRLSEWNPELYGDSLFAIRELTRKRDPQTFLPSLRERCGKAGVAVVIAETPAKCPVSGATFFGNTGNPVVMISCRHKTDDQFWFTFFHESAHLLLHSEEDCFLELEHECGSDTEREANAFAAETLVPRKYHQEMFSLGSNAKKIIRFARDVGVSPGIVVGQMQYYGILRHNQQRRLKRSYSLQDGVVSLERR